MDAEEENKRAKLAQSDLNLVQEFLDEERSKLFSKFVGSVACDDLYEIHQQASALTSLEDYLISLVNTGRLNKEFNQ